MILDNTKYFYSYYAPYCYILLYSYVCLVKRKHYIKTVPLDNVDKSIDLFVSGLWP